MNKNVKLYIILTLAISWIATIIFYLIGKLNGMVTIIMLFPAICAIIIRIKSKSSVKDMLFNPNRKGIFPYAKALIFAILFPTIIIVLCAITGGILYKVPLDKMFFKTIFNYQIFAYILPKSFISMSIIFSFGFAQCYLISNGLYPVVVMHTFWNMLNPLILGSIYSGTAGIVLLNAPVEIVNGEGILGIVFAGIFAIIMISRYRKNELRGDN